MAIVTIKTLSQLEGQKRVDAEYYKPEYEQIRNRLKKIETQRVKDMAESVVSFGAYSLCNYIVWRENGVPYLNVENIKEGYIDWEDVKHIDEDVNQLLRKSQVREGQVILTMAGTIGNAAVAYKLPGSVNSNQATAKISLRRGMSPFFLSAFLNSFYGKKQTEWEIVTSVQPNIFLWQIENIRVPVMPEKVQKSVEEVYKAGLDNLSLSKSLRGKAESLLLAALGLHRSAPKLEQSYVSKLSDVISMHRADAEYFQPIYKELMKGIGSHATLRRLGSLITSFQRGIEVGADNYRENGKPFIRVSDLTSTGFVEGGERKYIAEELYESCKTRYRPKMGELLVTKDATPGIAYVVKEEVTGIIASGIVRMGINTKEINREYLALCINSLVGEMQVERDGGGSVITHWRPRQIMNLQIPVVSRTIQDEIASLMLKSHDARTKGMQLLSQAKRKVEDFIEKHS